MVKNKYNIGDRVVIINPNTERNITFSSKRHIFIIERIDFNMEKDVAYYFEGYQSGTYGYNLRLATNIIHEIW